MLDGLDPSVLTFAIRTTVGAALLEAGDVERGLAPARSWAARRTSPRVEAGRRAWLYAYLTRAELSRGRRPAAESWLARRARRRSPALELPMAESALLRRAPSSSSPATQPDAAGALALRGRRARRRRGRARCRPPAAARSPAARSSPPGSGSEAEAELQIAEAELDACGALRLRDEAARELRRLGHHVTARQRRAAGGAGLDTLSGRERDIVALVAQGRTNREIGDELFLSAKTVEGHLTNVFAKLGVRTRTEVAEAVGRAPAARSRSRSSPRPSRVGQPIPAGLQASANASVQISSRV